MLLRLQRRVSETAFFAPKLYKGTARGKKHGKRTKVDINMKAGRFARNPPAFYWFVFSNGKKSFSEFFVRVLGEFIDILNRCLMTAVFAFIQQYKFLLSHRYLYQVLHVFLSLFFMSF